MFQDLLIDHVNEFPSAFAAQFPVNAVRAFRNSFAIGNLESYQVGVVNGTPTVGQWAGVGCSISDPEQRGPMVFSWDATLMGNTAPLACLPLLLDRQAPAAAPTGWITFAATTDFNWWVPDCDWTAGAAWRLQTRGRMLVNTSITSATGGITTREFGVSVAVQLPATITEISFSVSCRLYSVQEPFFQPGK